MGPKEGRSGPAKVKNKRREQMNKAIEDTVSDVMTPKRSFLERLSDFSTDMVERANEAREEAYGTKKFGMGGDVRYNPNRGKTY